MSTEAFNHWLHGQKLQADQDRDLKALEALCADRGEMDGYIKLAADQHHHEQGFKTFECAFDAAFAARERRR